MVNCELERGCRPIGMQEASRLKRKERNQPFKAYPNIISHLTSALL